MISYNYSATQNNGQITQVVDSISGETVSYQYDNLETADITPARRRHGRKRSRTSGFGEPDEQDAERGHRGRSL